MDFHLHGFKALLVFSRDLREKCIDTGRSDRCRPGSTFEMRSSALTNIFLLEGIYFFSLNPKCLIFRNAGNADLVDLIGQELRTLTARPFVYPPFRRRPLRDASETVKEKM